MSAAILDAEFATLMRRVEAALHGAPRQIRARGELWAQRLGFLASVPQEELRRDRNLQAALLLQCIEEGHWVEPMDRHPPEGPLPRLPPHVACMLRRRRQERMDLARGGVCFQRAAPPTSAPPYASAASCSSESLRSSDASYDDLGDRPFLLESAPCVRFSPRHEVENIPPGGTAACEHPLHGTNASLAGAAACAMSCTSAPRRQTVPSPEVSTGTTVPPAYASLAARVAHLQDENRRLRRKLEQRSVTGASGVCARGTAGFQSSRLASRPAPRLPKRCNGPEDDTAPDPGSAARHNGLCTNGAPHDLALAALEYGSLSARIAGQPHVHDGAEPTSAIGAARLPCLLDVSNVPAHHDEVYKAGEWWPKDCMTDTGLSRKPHEEVCEVSQWQIQDRPGPPPPEDDNEGFLRYLDDFQAYTGKLCASEGLPIRGVALTG